PQNRPAPIELGRCQGWLERELVLLTNLEVVVTLGSIALRSWLEAAGWWSKLSPRQRPKFGHGEESTLPDGTTLISSYHPSRQNTNTGKLTRPMWHGIFARARGRLSERERASSPRAPRRP